MILKTVFYNKSIVNVILFGYSFSFLISHKTNGNHEYVIFINIVYLRKKDSYKILKLNFT